MAKKIASGLITKKLKALKKSGLIDLDLRKVTHNALEKDKKLRGNLLRTIKRYDDVLEGKAKASKVSDKKALVNLKSRGYKSRKNIVLIPKKKDETVVLDRKGNITYLSDVTDAKTGLPYTKIIREPNFNISKSDDLETIVNQYAEIYKAETGNRIAFTYYGNISRKTYSDVKEALLAVLAYEQKQNEIGTSLNPADVPEALKAIQILEYVKNDNRANAMTAEIRAGNKRLLDLFNIISR